MAIIGMEQRSFSSLVKVAFKESVKSRFAVEAHLSSLFGTEVKEPVDEVGQDIPQEEPADNVSL